MNLVMRTELKLLKPRANGLIFLEKDGVLPSKRRNVKKKSVEARLPYVRKFHQYLLYTAFNEEP